MVVDHPYRLHERVADRGTHELETPTLELLAHGIGLRRGGGDLGHPLPGVDFRLAAHVTSQVGGKPVPFAQLQRFVLYVVPISIPVTNRMALNDPEETGLVEWAQLYPGPGREEDTEWVRYNVITADRQIARVHDGPWRRTHWVLTNQQGTATLSLTAGGGGQTDVMIARRLAFQPQRDDGLQRIGYIDDLEITFPIVFQTRRALQFRGDSFGGTSSHGFQAADLVTACHRLELDWGRLGALSARVGRNDRVAMVGGKQASGDSRPPLEWHTVNWKTSG